MVDVKIIGTEVTVGTTIQIIASMGTRMAIGKRVAGTPMTGAAMAIAKEDLTAAMGDGDIESAYPPKVNRLRVNHSGQLQSRCPGQPVKKT
ncbi:MAG: hypothetical protein KQI81_11595 [Deltaproteobacteria bacterium]|nr:hypothetical protein [Deltaproteobacteria bacterium]